MIFVAGCPVVLVTSQSLNGWDGRRHLVMHRKQVTQYEEPQLYFNCFVPPVLFAGRACNTPSLSLSFNFDSKF